LQVARRYSADRTVGRAPRPVRRGAAFPNWALSALIVLAVGVIGLRLALPHVVRNYVNRTLSKIPDYRGEVGDIDIHWRGAYTIHDANVVRTSGKVPVPFSAR
jgi:hypothetical protein